MKKLYLIALSFITLIPALLNADICWSPDGGWSASGGILEPILGKSITIADAENGLQVGCDEYSAGNILPAIRAYKNVYDCYPLSAQAPEALYQIGLIYMESHQYEQAVEALQTIILEYPGYPKFNEVIKIQFDIASQLQCGNRPYYWGIIPGFKDYNLAIKYFESIVTNAPYTEYAPMALMNIADLASEHGRIEDVIDSLDRIVCCYRRSDFAPCAYVKLGDAYAKMVYGPAYDQGATVRSINYYQDFLLLFPDNPLVPEVEVKLANGRDLYARSKLTLGDFYYKYRNNFEAARIYYNETITAAPNSYAAQEAMQRLELVDNCVYPPKTWVDQIFGRYQRPSTPAYLEDSIIAAQQNEAFARDVNPFPIRDVDRGTDEFAPGQDPVPSY